MARRPGHLVPTPRAPCRPAPCSTSTAGGTWGPHPACTRCSWPWLCRRTGCEIFVADIRLAPEFPFPAGLEDAVLVLEALLAAGPTPTRLFVAGDSSGGGLVGLPPVLGAHTGPPPTHGRRPPVLAGARPPARRAVRHGRTPTGTSCPGTSRPRPTSTGGTPVSAPVSGGQPGRVRLAPHLRLLRQRRDVPGCHPAPLSTTCRSPEWNDVARGARDVPRLPHPDAVGRGEPAGATGPSESSSAAVCPRPPGRPVSTRRRGGRRRSGPSRGEVGHDGRGGEQGAGGQEGEIEPVSEGAVGRRDHLVDDGLDGGVALADLAWTQPIGPDDGPDATPGRIRCAILVPIPRRSHMTPTVGRSVP